MRTRAVLVLLSVVGISAACGEMSSSCDDTLTCSDVDGSSAAGGMTAGAGGGSSTGGNNQGGEPSLGGSSGAGGTAEGGACGECPDTLPICDYATGECAECLTEGDCVSGRCSTAHECVQCLDNADCSGDAPICKGDSCVKCSTNEDCSALGLNVCLPSGACAECTPETDDRNSVDDACGEHVCDPQTNTCDNTKTQLAQSACGACIADTQCATGHDCVRTYFQPGGANVDMGGFCLRRVSAGACMKPYVATAIQRGTLSDPESTEQYCGFAEEYTSCPAILDRASSKECVVDSDCGAAGVDDGLCKQVGLAVQCTHECGVANHCSSGACSGSPSYCGG